MREGEFSSAHFFSGLHPELLKEEIDKSVC